MSVHLVVMQVGELGAAAADVGLNVGQYSARRKQSTLKIIGPGAIRHRRNIGRKLGGPFGHKLVVEIRRRVPGRRNKDPVDQLAELPWTALRHDLQRSVARLEKLRGPLAKRRPMVNGALHYYRL